MGAAVRGCSLGRRVLRPAAPALSPAARRAGAGAAGGAEAGPPHAPRRGPPQRLAGGGVRRRQDAPREARQRGRGAAEPPRPLPHRGGHGRGPRGPAADPGLVAAAPRHEPPAPRHPDAAAGLRALRRRGRPRRRPRALPRGFPRPGPQHLRLEALAGGDRGGVPAGRRAELCPAGVGGPRRSAASEVPGRSHLVARRLAPGLLRGRGPARGRHRGAGARLPLLADVQAGAGNRRGVPLPLPPRPPPRGAGPRRGGLRGPPGLPHGRAQIRGHRGGARAAGAEQFVGVRPSPHGPGGALGGLLGLSAAVPGALSSTRATGARRPVGRARGKVGESGVSV
mmetsp:Transcript_16248/g.46452  ORF Transcript_16248/g.46452 Transcript_16248/m.46452 type:complete len:339 (+) Transcript_16248:153-1169(+)